MSMGKPIEGTGFGNALDLIHDGLKILEDVKSAIEIDSRGKSKTRVPVTRASVIPVIYVKVNQTLNVFLETANFIKTNSRFEDRRKFKFYIPNLRSLIDIYGKLLYALSKSDTEQALLFIGGDIETIIRIIKNEPHNDNTKLLVDSYSENLKLNTDILNEARIVLPDNPHELSISRLKALNMLFPTMDEVLDVELIKAASPTTAKSFPRAINGLYRTFSGFSNYSHGNPLTIETSGKECYWIVSKLLLLSALVLEMLDKHFLQRAHAKEIGVWLKRVDDDIESLTSEWSQY